MVSAGFWAVLLTFLGQWSLATAGAAETQLRLRFAWGGGARRAWQASITVDQGTLSELVPLGIEADEPGAMWLESPQEMRIRQRSGRTYDAFDLLVTGELSTAKLNLQLQALDDNQISVTESIPLASLLQSTHATPLDKQGNRLLIKRAPGDVLRLQLQRESLVFSPGEHLQLVLQPQLQMLAAGANVRISASLATVSGDRVAWNQEFDVRIPSATEAALELPLDIPLPEQEAVYDLTISASERSLRQRLVPASLSKAIAERKLQLVVVSPKASPAPQPTDADWQLVGEIDPANPAWWHRMPTLPSLKRIPGWPQGPLRHGDVLPWQHDPKLKMASMGTFTMLSAKNGKGPLAWEAFPLPVDQPGMPHVLELEFPGDTPQNLGISILEPNAAGAVLPIGIDAGVYLAATDVKLGTGLQKQRIIFWPRTRTPLVLLTQREADQPAIFGKLRVFTRTARLPRFAPLVDGESLGGKKNERLSAGYLDRPLFPENFSAGEVVDTSLGQTVDDWETFLQGGTRLTDYLQHSGQNGVMLSVLADGSAIYPSPLLASTPRYDTGQIGTLGRDPLRKDVLELLYRLFDREHLALIPALHFTAPLPQVEELLRRGGRESLGVSWIGPEGQSWLEQQAPVRELAPYYNPLNERVQQAMLAVFHELAVRSAAHVSFQGIAIPLSADGYAQLLGPEWGLDDDTIAQFERDTQTRVVVKPGEDRYQQRADYLLGEGRAEWLQWRAQRLAQLYRRMELDLQSVRPGAKLYLAPTSPLDSARSREQLRPALPQRAKVEEALLELGLAPQLYSTRPNIVFLRPHRSQPPANLGALAMDLQLREASGLHQLLGRQAQTGSLFYHPPQRMRLESFDRQSPYGAANTYTLLVSQPVPALDLSRRELIRSLATADSVSLFDGGWLLPLGQEDVVRPLRELFRQLPAVPFATSSFSRQPVTIRTHQGENESYVYLVNDSPWKTSVRVNLNISADSSWKLLGKNESEQRLQHDAAGTYWQVELNAYDLVAAEFPNRAVRVTGAEVQLPPEVEQNLDLKIQELGDRAAALEEQPPLAVLENPGFELPTKEGGIPGWIPTKLSAAALTMDREQPHGGKAALRFNSDLPVASLQSNLFPTPSSGRLAVSVWLRIADANQQPVLRLAVEGPSDGQGYYRFAQVGNGGIPLKAEWTQYIFPVEDLPLEGLSQMCVRFDLMGQGTVWMDDVQLYHLKFSQNERIELSKILVSARGALRNGELSNCLNMLQGYWPQFLARQVPAAAVETPRAARAEPPPASPPPAPGTMDRLKEYVPKFMRF